MVMKMKMDLFDWKSSAEVFTVQQSHAMFCVFSLNDDDPPETLLLLCLHITKLNQSSQGQDFHISPLFRVLLQS